MIAMRQPEACIVPVHHQRLSILFLIWLWVSCCCSVWFTYLLAPSFSNDLWWAYYNISGDQTFLIDSINYFFKTTPELGEVDITSILSDRNYAGDITYPIIYPAEGMAVLTKFITLTHAIHSLRNMSYTYALWVPVQFCWVDFNKQWEIATTQERQTRCLQKYSSNAAVYLEAVLRNTQWNGFISNSGGPGNLFTVGIQYALEETKEGRQWLNATANCKTSFTDELDYWKSYFLISFELQWQNAIITGLDERVDIVNALGIGQPITIKATGQVSGPWTSGIFNGFLNNNLNFVVVGCNSSIVRGSSFYFMNVPCDYLNPPAFETLLGIYDESGNYINQTGLIHDIVGPYLAVDMWVVAVPTILMELVSAMNNILTNNLLGSKDARDQYNNIEDLELLPLPPKWNGAYYYYGGNPMCLTKNAQSFVQQSFSTTDSCNTPTPFSIALSKRQLIFGLSTVSESVNVICSMQNSTDCRVELMKGLQLKQSISISSLDTERAIAVISQLNISIMQFASDLNQSNWSLLVQPLLGDEWAFYGWIMLYDWAIGIREVVAFEGDNGILVLMSEAYSTKSNSPSVDIITNSSYVIYYLVVYFTGILVILTIASTITAITYRFKFDGRNLFFFHRIGGSTWLGRPLMFLRGCTAILLLSSAPLTLARYQSLSKFQSTPYSSVMAMVLINEANWVTYVISEFLLLFNPRNIRLSGPLSCLVVWIIYLFVHLVYPVSVTAQLKRSCTIENLYFQVHCSGSTVSIGSYSRVCFLLLVPVIVVPVVTLALSFLKVNEKKLQIVDYSGAAQEFFISAKKDSITDLLGGFVPWTKNRVFNFNLWILRSPSAELSNANKLSPGELSVTLGHKWMQHFWKISGICYIVAAIYSSVSYLGIAEVNWANDLIWPGFNMTGTHLYIANWYLQCISLGAPVGSYQLDQTGINSLATYNMTSTVLMPPHGFGSRVHYTNLTGITDSIKGIRELDGCMAPWISTQYCFVDFEQRWEMANSLKRQIRCASMVENGAIFLESILRNVQWDDWTDCWGDAFNTAIARDLQQSSEGKEFLRSVSSSWIGILDEAIYWTSFGIKHYKLQWQNYKYIGSINMYSIVNAYGGQYPFTIQSTPGEYRWSHQTSFKMYWGLGNDLDAVVNNKTSLVGKSLIRSSSSFAFANTSLQQVFLENGTILSPPLTVGAMVSVDSLGPFGSIDMKYVIVPDILTNAARAIIEAAYRKRGESRLFLRMYTNITWPTLVLPIPQKWLNLGLYTFGGSILCPPTSISGTSGIRTGMLQFFSFSRQCAASLVVTYLNPHSEHIIFAATIASLSSQTNLTVLCSQVAESSSSCSRIVKATLLLLDALGIDDLREQWKMRAYNSARELNIQILQFGVLNSTSSPNIFRKPLVDSTDSVFDFFAWIFIYDWIIGGREVVLFEGDNDSWTLLGDGGINNIQPIDTTEIPLVFSIYAHRVVEYITSIMILLAILTAIYIILSYGLIAGGNMLELSRVGGIIWVGRPLLFARGITALSLLATATLKLENDRTLSHFSAGNLPWYITCFAANEITWLGGIVTDIGLIYTTDYAIYYSTWNSVLVWIISACLTTFVPVQHNAEFSPHCEIVTLDFQVQCSSGSIAIGSLERFVLLILVVIVSNILCYAIVRYIWPSVTPRRGESILLSAGAKYLLDNEDWVISDVYYMDRATAVLCGLLSFELRHSVYVFDVKGWRLHVIKRDMTSSLERRLQLAIPLPQ